ncbi:MAG: cadherin-like beta sandwich domain-containing protein, partial [Proteobacteria bacterium]
HYIITITRQAAANADLNRIVLGTGSLSPALNPAITTYSATVTDVVSMSITPFTTDNAATMLFEGTPLVSGTPAGVNLVIGNNVFSIEVTAADGTTKKTYVLNITRLAATNADLSALAISTGTLTPVFASGTVTYNAAVTNATTSITVTPTKSTGSSTVRVNGTIVANATASQALPLSVGANTISVAVTAEDGTTIKTYTITVNRAASANAALASLSLSSGTLSPVFAQATTNYAANVTNATTTIQVTPTSSDASATITVNGVAVASGSASANIPLTVGTNAISTVVTAQDGTSTATYTVVVTRAASANADLSTLTLSAGALSPAFASATTSYTSSVSNANNSITITPTLSDPTANVQVNGTSVASGASSAPVALTVGTNNITILVTAQNGSTKTYSVTVDRSPSGNADLASLSLSGGSLSPAFTAGNTTYSASVNNSVSAITFTPGVGEPNATVTVNGQAVASGTASAGIPLVVGPNVVSILVTAQNGVQKTYTVTVTRQPSANANLSALALSAGALTPTFAANVTTYNIAVANAVTSTTLTPTAGAGATIKVNGTTIASGSASANIPLTIGTNTITTVVTAQDGTTTKTYTVTVTRAASANANLSALSLSAGTLSPAFAAATTSYTASVSNTNTSVTFTPTVTDPTSSVKVNGTTVASGTASAPVALTVGANTIAIEVTAQNGTTKTYTVTVNRAQSPNADLATLTISASTLSPVFSPGNTSYSALVGNGVNSITFTPGVSEPNATVTVNGQAVSSGSASAAIPLVVGPNVVTIVTSAQNGTNKTYTVTITREAPPASPDATLSSLTLSAGAITPTFDANVTSYNVTVANTVTGTTVTPTVTVAGATIKVNGATVASGATSAGIPLIVGSNTITTVVTAQDGIGINVYTVTIIRQPSSVATWRRKASTPAMPFGWSGC